MIEAPGWRDLARRHQRWGWRGLVVSVSLGLALEGFHAFKVDAYLDHAMRREIWTLRPLSRKVVAAAGLRFPDDPETAERSGCPRSGTAGRPRATD